jgi:hypothetical protein
MRGRRDNHSRARRIHRASDVSSIRMLSPASPRPPYASRPLPLRTRPSPRKCKGDEGEEKEEADREGREREVSVRLLTVNLHGVLISRLSYGIRSKSSAARNGEAPK